MEGLPKRWRSIIWAIGWSSWISAFPTYLLCYWLKFSIMNYNLYSGGEGWGALKSVSNRNTLLDFCVLLDFIVWVLSMHDHTCPRFPIMERSEIVNQAPAGGDCSVFIALRSNNTILRTVKRLAEARQEGYSEPGPTLIELGKQSLKKSSSNVVFLGYRLTRCPTWCLYHKSHCRSDCCFRLIVALRTRRKSVFGSEQCNVPGTYFHSKLFCNLGNPVKFDTRPQIWKDADFFMGETSYNICRNCLGES